MKYGNYMDPKTYAAYHDCVARDEKDRNKIHVKLGDGVSLTFALTVDHFSVKLEGSAQTPFGFAPFHSATVDEASKKLWIALCKYADDGTMQKQDKASAWFQKNFL